MKLRIFRGRGAAGEKTRAAAHAMVNATLAGTVQHIRLMHPDDRSAAATMAAFYHELNEQQGWGQ